MWIYLNNQFINKTKKNYKKGLILSNFHLAALAKAKEINANDADIDKMYQRYYPLAQTLANEYATWKQLGGIKEANTLNVDQLLATVSSKLNKWQPVIESKFEKNTPEFKAILPNGRMGLTTGAKEERMLAIKNLSKSLDGIADLANIKTQVDAFFAEIEAARSTQLGNKSAESKSSNAVAHAVFNAMTMQYRNLGLLMDKHFNEPEIIESYFDLNTLQQSNQTSFTGTLSPLEKEAILVNTFLPGDELSLKITGNSAARFYLSNITNGVNSEMVQVAPGAAIVVNVAKFAVPDYSTYRYLTAHNPSTTETLKYEVEML